jgi:hypothetical protein
MVAVLTLAVVFVMRNASVGERHITRLSASIRPTIRNSRVPPACCLTHRRGRQPGRDSGQWGGVSRDADYDSPKRSITFETPIYWSGSIGQEFAQALDGRAPVSQFTCCSIGLAA